MGLRYGEHYSIIKNGQSISDDKFDITDCESDLEVHMNYHHDDDV